MQRTASIRLITAAGFALSTLLSAQTHTSARNKPPAAVPATVAPPVMPPPPPPTPAQLPPDPANVAYADGVLSITASNSSLNQILRDISHQTGMKITGTVTDERVFGKYGPDAPEKILGTLLAGTSSNFLLVRRDGTTTEDLVLSPRQGGITPPNPHAFVDDSHPDDEPAATSQPVDPPPTAAVQPGAGHPPEDTASPAGPASSDPNQQQSPNGVKTPQQIYDQLQNLRKQQQQTSTIPQ
jgi:hypothetical protein